MVYLEPFFLLLWEYFWKYGIWDEGGHRLTAGGLWGLSSVPCPPTCRSPPADGDSSGPVDFTGEARYSGRSAAGSRQPEWWLVEARPAVTLRGCGQGSSTSCGSWGSADPPWVCLWRPPPRHGGWGCVSGAAEMQLSLSCWRSSELLFMFVWFYAMPKSTR